MDGDSKTCLTKQTFGFDIAFQATVTPLFEATAPNQSICQQPKSASDARLLSAAATCEGVGFQPFAQTVSGKLIFEEARCRHPYENGHSRLRFTTTEMDQLHPKTECRSGQ
ncbi:MAG: hypothetical protein R8G34_13410 [Paracoccaceae bacterium]|nr:hypothetical protein [Paracoccaceae bacterium]